MGRGRGREVPGLEDVPEGAEVGVKVFLAHKVEVGDIGRYYFS